MRSVLELFLFHPVVRNVRATAPRGDVVSLGADFVVLSAASRTSVSRLVPALVYGLAGGLYGAFSGRSPGA